MAEDFQKAAMVIDNQQKTLTRANLYSSFAIEPQLAKLRDMKLALVNEKVRQLHTSIGDVDADRVKHYVMDYVRRKVRIVPPRSTGSTRE